LYDYALDPAGNNLRIQHLSLNRCVISPVLMIKLSDLNIQNNTGVANQVYLSYSIQ
jgi:hypothetical protein